MLSNGFAIKSNHAWLNPIHPQQVHSTWKGYFLNMHTIPYFTYRLPFLIVSQPMWLMLVSYVLNICPEVVWGSKVVWQNWCGGSQSKMWGDPDQWPVASIHSFFLSLFWHGIFPSMVQLPQTNLLVEKLQSLGNKRIRQGVGNKIRIRNIGAQS